MKSTAAIILTLIILFSGGCLLGDKIGDILKKPEEYSGKTVNIKGEVTEVLSIPFIAQGAYKVDDGSGSIWVITTSGTPAKGKEVSVKGTVRTTYTIGNIKGTVVLEETRS